MALDPWIVVIGLLVAYFAFVVWLLRTGRMERWNLSLMGGVVLMQRTQHGKGAIDAIARPRRLWNVIGDLGIVLTLGGMVAITVFFLWSVWLSIQPGSGVPALGVAEIFVIPGVNPFVPLWYGLLALAVTLVVHEGGHGILARANGMKLRSLGLLWLVVPIGAFVEPEELDLKVASRRARLRVFGAGPAVNLGFAAASLACFALLIGSLTPTDGAWIRAVGDDLPAKQAGITGGDTIVAFAGQPVRDWDGLTTLLNGTRPGDVVDVGLADGREVTVRLTSHWDALEPEAQEDIRAMEPGAMAYCEAVLGTRPAGGGECADDLHKRSRLGVSGLQPRELEFMAHPFTGRGEGVLCPGAPAILCLTSLPIQEVFNRAPVLSVYMPAFYEEPFHSATFWTLVGILFWVFWINLMVGVTNILPMLPLDGGHIFREAVGGIMAKLRPGLPSERRDRMVATAATSMSFLILGAFLLMVLGPHFLR